MAYHAGRSLPAEDLFGQAKESRSNASAQAAVGKAADVADGGLATFDRGEENGLVTRSVAAEGADDERRAVAAGYEKKGPVFLIRDHPARGELRWGSRFEVDQGSDKRVSRPPARFNPKPAVKRNPGRCRRAIRVDACHPVHPRFRFRPRSRKCGWRLDYGPHSRARVIGPAAPEGRIVTALRTFSRGGAAVRLGRDSAAQKRQRPRAGPGSPPTGTSPRAANDPHPRLDR